MAHFNRHLTFQQSASTNITPEVIAQGCSNVGTRAAAVPRCGTWGVWEFLFCAYLCLCCGARQCCGEAWSSLESVLLYGSEKVCPLAPFCTRCQGSLMDFTDLNPKCIQRKCSKLLCSVKSHHLCFSCVSVTRNCFGKEEAEEGEWPSEAAVSMVKDWLTHVCLQLSPLRDSWFSTGTCPAAAGWVLPLAICCSPVSTAFPAGALSSACF